MTRMIATLTALIMGMLICISHYLPNSIYMWFASPSSEMIYLRVGVILLIFAYLIIDLFTLPYVRAALLGLSVAVVYEVIHIGMKQGLGLLDFLAFSASGVAFLIFALESEIKVRRLSLPKTVPAVHKLAQPKLRHLTH